VETLISLALLFRTAFVVAWERIDRGLIAEDPPPALVDALDMPERLAA
jgi:hypothetical protein